MKVSVLLQTTDYRGDHAADVAHAIDLKPNETVVALVERLLVDPQYKAPPKVRYCDRIELRAVNEA